MSDQHPGINPPRRIVRRTVTYGPVTVAVSSEGSYGSHGRARAKRREHDDAYYLTKDVVRCEEMKASKVR